MKSYKKNDALYDAEKLRIGLKHDVDTLLAELGTYREKNHEIPIPGDNILEDLKLYAYPDFGLYIYKSRRLYLAIRCGSVGQNGNGGHSHNDQLSIELNVDGNDWIVDPGTYIYTPLPERRNNYRSVNAHFAPGIEGMEPARLDFRLFELGNSSSGECLYFREDGFVGMYFGYGKPVWLKVTLFRDNILLKCCSPKTKIKFLKTKRQLFSPGYGIQIM